VQQCSALPSVLMLQLVSQLHPATADEIVSNGNDAHMASLLVIIK